MFQRRYRKGDWVIYRQLKCTTHPGPRAHNIDASVNGDTYSYFVDKYWIVAEVLADGSLLIKTRRGKTHIIDARDHQLRPASLLQRVLNRSRFAFST
jgi:hypothetical protein